MLLTFHLLEFLDVGLGSQHSGISRESATRQHGRHFQGNSPWNLHDLARVINGKVFSIAAVRQVFIGEENDSVTQGEVAVGNRVADIVDGARNFHTFNRQ